MELMRTTGDTAPTAGPVLPGRVLLIDDHALLAQALALLLADGLGLQSEVCTSCEAGMERLKASSNWVLVLLDLELPGMGGLEALPRIRTLAPHVPVVVVSSNLAAMAKDAVLQRGAAGFVSKSESSDRLLAVLRRVLSRAAEVEGQAGPTGGAAQTARDAPSGGAVTRAGSVLSQRQREVLLLLAEGKSNKLVARRLEMSENTVRNHVAAILDRLQVANRFEAVASAQKLGLLTVAA